MSELPSSPGPSLAQILRDGPLATGRLTGSRLGPYVVSGKIASGAMGVVLRAVDVRDGRPVALKVLGAGAGASGAQRERFVREAHIAARVDHPAVVRVLDAGETDRLPWLAMELIDGETLGARARDLAPETLVQLVIQVARGLGAVHRAGIVHRDIKPDNILLREDGQPVLADFGVARDLGLSQDLTRTGVMLGTPAYMAPEQFRGERLTPAGDVYSLGVVLYEALTGRLPFEAENVVQLCALIAAGAPAPPSRFQAGLGGALDRVCLRALAADPTRRYADGSALATALHQAQVGHRPRRSVAPWVVSAAVLVGGVVGALLVGSRAAPTPPAVHTPAASRSPAAPPPPARHELVLVADRDATVRNDSLYENDNAGLEPQLQVGDRPGRGGDFRALLAFAWEDLPDDAQVESASLELFLEGTLFAEADVVVEAWALVGELPGDVRLPWLEGTSLHDAALDGVAWGGPGVPPQFWMPALERARDLGLGVGQPAARVRIAAASGAGWVRWDVTRLVQAWRAGQVPAEGLALVHEREGPPYGVGVKCFAAAETEDAQRQPRLRVRYVGSAPLDRGGALRQQARDARWREALAERQPARRLSLLGQALLADPGFGPAWAERGALFLARGDPSNALTSLERGVVAREPAEGLRYRVAHADALLQMGAPERALDVARRTLAGAEDAELRVLLGEALLALGRPAEATTAFARALELAPNHPRARRGLEACR